MKRLAALLIIVVSTAACAPAPVAHTTPTLAQWMQEAMALHPTLAAEMAAVPQVYTTDPTFSWAALSYGPFYPGGERVEWSLAAPDWEEGWRLDIMAHEAAHILAFHRWPIDVAPPNWPSNEVNEVESFADCLATAIRNHVVEGHGGCVGDPTQAFYLVATTQPIWKA